MNEKQAHGIHGKHGNRKNSHIINPFKFNQCNLWTHFK